MKFCTTASGILALFIVFLNASCTKPTIDPPVDIKPPPDATTSPVRVQGQAVASTIIGYTMVNETIPYTAYYNWLGANGKEHPIHSDIDGYFHLESDDFSEDATILKDNGAFKDVLFPLSYPILVQKHRIHFIWKMYPNETYNSSQTAASLENGVTIKSIGVKTEANSWIYQDKTYSQSMELRLLLLNNTTKDLVNSQPGDMRGVNKKGETVYLHPYLMTGITSSVMFYFPATISPGKKISLHVPIAEQTQKIAPDQATTWMYDRDKALWQELDVAKKNGTYYDLSVPQTGIFAVASATPLVYLHTRIVDGQGAILKYTQVTVTPQDETLWPVTVFTDNEGEFAAYVPAGEKFTLTIPYRCDHCFSVITLGPLTTNTWMVQHL